ncbi:MAG: helix-turn-helix domain-containing protein [Acidithiobacillus ferrivorans]
MRKAKQKPVGRQPKIDIGAELLASVREMKAGIRARVHCPEISAVGHARLASGLSQTAFAALLGVSVRTLQDWNRVAESRQARQKTLFRVAERHPEVLQELAA